MMRIQESVLLMLGGLAVVAQGASPLRVAADADRELQNNYNGNNAYGNYGYGGFDNWEEYMRFQMSQRSFTFTGCSSKKTEYGYTGVYVTFRVCDTCHENRQMGCDDSNGDYVVSMQEFGETYGEYWAEMTYQDRNNAPFACLKLEEYAEAQMYNNYQYGNNNNNNNGGGQNQNYNGNGNGNGNYQYYNNNQNNQVEYYVGPLCNGGSKVDTGLFYDEACAYPVEADTTIEDVLGFAPTNTVMDPPVCVPCMQTNYNNNGGQGELSPLCDRMLEESGRCDRTRRTTSYDQFYANQQQQGGGNGNGQNFGNACTLIDSLAHMQAARRSQTAKRAGIWTFVALSVIGIAFFVRKKGYLERFKGIKLVWPKRKAAATTTDSDYKRQTDDAAMT